MSSYNRTTLLGRLTRDSELRYLPDGAGVLNFDLAVSREWKDKASGQKKSEVLFMKVSQWGKMAETLAPFLKKGNLVLVEGRLKAKSWQTESGEKRTSIELNSDQVVMMPKSMASQPQEQRQIDPLATDEEPFE